MNFRKSVFVVVVALIVGTSILYAQSNATLRGGVYRATYMTGEARVAVSNHTGTTKYVTIYAPDGTYAIGTARISGMRVTVDLGNSGFDIWTIINNEEFTASGVTYIWIRNLRDGEIKTR
jgi:hypothetical protein